MNATVALQLIGTIEPGARYLANNGIGHDLVVYLVSASFNEFEGEWQTVVDYTYSLKDGECGSGRKTLAKFVELLENCKCTRAI